MQFRHQLKSYGLENKGISYGMQVSRATENSHNSVIPEAQTFPSHSSGNRNFTGISGLWFPIEYPWLEVVNQLRDLVHRL